jgi:hypothetical protein
MEKKKVLFLADREAWEGIQKLQRQNKVDPKFFNAILNMFLRKQYEELDDFFQEMQDSKGGVNQMDLYRYMGKVMQALEVGQLELPNL